MLLRWTLGFAHYRTSNIHDARYSIFPFRLLIWILRMTDAMLVLLAAYRVRQLRNCFGADIVNLGGHLEQLLSCWMRFPGEAVSPSVEQGIHLIRLVEGSYRTNITRHLVLGNQTRTPHKCR